MMKLINNSEMQRVTVNLKKNVKREYSLRLFLDANVEYGFNRKESVLKMYELLLANGLIDENLMFRNKPFEEGKSIRALEQEIEKAYNSEIQEIDPNKDPSDFDGI